MVAAEDAGGRAAGAQAGGGRARTIWLRRRICAGAVHHGTSRRHRQRFVPETDRNRRRGNKPAMDPTAPLVGERGNLRPSVLRPSKARPAPTGSALPSRRCGRNKRRVGISGAAWEAETGCWARRDRDLEARCPCVTIPQGQRSLTRQMRRMTRMRLMQPMVMRMLLKLMLLVPLRPALLIVQLKPGGAAAQLWTHCLRPPRPRPAAGLPHYGDRSPHRLGWPRASTAGATASQARTMTARFSRTDRKSREARLQEVATRRAAQTGREARARHPLPSNLAQRLKRRGRGNSCWITPTSRS